LIDKAANMLTIELLSSVRLIAFDFDGVFTDNTVYVTQDGVESVRCWRSDGLGLSRLRRVGVQAFIISTEANPVVSARAQKLNIACKQGVEDKAAAVLATCSELHIPPEQTIFLGNDINDIPAFKSVGLPVAVADAYPEIYPYVLYRTQKRGGMGAVREICDLVYNARNADKSEV
jgi:3-deoxy-D-manno-octulosonate 8-phosphate phosphatase (KDO 8-P phosphatase)